MSHILRAIEVEKKMVLHPGDVQKKKKIISYTFYSDEKKVKRVLKNVTLERRKEK